MSLDPTAIGRYSVQRALGRGAMGIVWLATDPLLKRPVAIKTLLNPNGDDAGVMLERFRREAEISARLNHPNIITVHDVGSDPVVGPFLAMEFVDGVSLSVLFRRKPPLETLLRLLIQGMAGLMAAGQAGIVHRDVKPENLLVSRDGRVKLMDFGIARANESHLTQAGMVFGTPSYTAPELLKGLEAGPATDQYAFAVTCLEGLTGKLPFLGTSVASTLYKVVHEVPDFPEHLAPGLRPVFLKALEKEPELRFPDLPSFMRALVSEAPLAVEPQARLLALLEGDEPVVAPQALQGLELEGSPAKTDPEVPSRKPTLPLRALAIAGGVVVLGGLAWVGIGALRVAKHPLTIHTDPPGAQATLGGKVIGVTPVEGFLVRDDRPPGALRLELPGYTPLDVEVESDDRILEYTLHRPGTEVQLTTQPPGAEILVDGVPKGRTPGRVELPASGEATVTLRLEGYREWQAKLPQGGPVPERIELAPATFETRIVTDPPGAEVFVNALPAGRSPLEGLLLKGGQRHAIRLKLAGYADWTGLVEEGKPLPAPIRLTRAR